MIRVKCPISKSRSARPINIAHSFLPLVQKGSRYCSEFVTSGGATPATATSAAAAAVGASSSNDTKITNMLFHKSIMGHILVALNALNCPVLAWSDTAGVMPIRYALLNRRTTFRSLLARYKPRRLYLNDGALLEPLPTAADTTLLVYANKTLDDILADIRGDCSRVVSTAAAVERRAGTPPRTPSMFKDTTTTTTTAAPVVAAAAQLGRDCDCPADGGGLCVCCSGDDGDAKRAAAEAAVGPSSLANKPAGKQSRPRQQLDANVPTYREMLQMDEGLTRQEYRNFIKSLRKLRLK